MNNYRKRTNRSLNRTRRMTDGFGLLVLAFWGIVILAVVGIIGVNIASATLLSSEKNCTVTDKDRTTGTDGKSNMRVYTSCGVFNVADDLLSARFSSADTYASIEVGQTYDFDTRGIRFPILSKFPNVLEVK